MTTNPYAAPQPPTRPASDSRSKPPRIASRRPPLVGYGHAIVFAPLWMGFTILVYMAVGRELDRASERPEVVALTTIASVTGPMVGAISRGCQGCCLRCSLSLLAYCGPALLLTVAAQWFWRPRHWLLRAVRLVLWAVGWSVWFGGGFVSLGHALS